MLAIHSLLRMRNWQLQNQKAQGCSADSKMGQPVSGNAAHPQKACFNTRSAEALQTMLQVCFCMLCSSKDPQRGKTGAAGTAAVSHRHGASQLHIECVYQQNALRSTWPSDQTLHGAKSQDSSRGHPPAAALFTATLSEPLSPLLTLRHANKLSQAGRRLLILILRDFLTWIGTRKRKLRSTHNDEEN